MKSFKLVFILFFIGYLGRAQQLKGRVLDAKTHKAIVFANVYFNGTFRGTTTDTLGYFSLKLIKNQLLPITVSFVGYKSSKIINYNTNKLLTIYLKPKVFDLPIVEIKSGKTRRKQKERIFKREFLGSSLLAKYCIIENMKDIKLVFSKDRKTLFAYAKKPILINNTYLGYNIEYYLDNFYYRRDTVFFQGSFYFKEKPLLDELAGKRFKEHRLKVYHGSKMHFIRSLYSNKLKAEGFKVLGSNRFKYNYDSIMTHKNSHYINIKNHIKISYLGIEDSNLYQLSDSIYISKNGFNNPYGILWTGYMGQQRLCDLLPFEYQPDKE